MEDYLVPLTKKGQLDLYTAFIASRWFCTIDDFINLELCSSRFLGNMEKFHYNPIPLTKRTRQFFTHLKTLYVYDKSTDELFLEDEKIIAREYCKNKKYDLFVSQCETLERWTKKHVGSILFDSVKDKWSVEHSDFERKVLGKRNLLFLIDDYSGNKFGYYLGSKIKKYNRWIPTTSKTFLFSLEHSGNTNQPEKFGIKFLFQGYVLYPTNNTNLIDIGDISLYKENYKTKSYCHPDKWCFNYHYSKNKLIPNTFIESRNHFIPKRILVIQML